MARMQCIYRRLFSFHHNSAGNFAIMTAICLPVLLGIGGGAFEIARAMQTKADLQTIADSAVLSATTKARLALGKLKEAELVAAANDYISASHFVNDLPPEQAKEFVKGVKITAGTQKTDKGEEIHVRSAITYDLPLNPLLRFIGHDTMRIHVESASKSSVNLGAALSLYLVLDRSGSMSFITDTRDSSRKSCPNFTEKNWGSSQQSVTSSPCYINKMSSLKLAVNYLTDTLRSSDTSYKASGTPQSQLIRTGAIAYNDSAFPAQALDWGVTSSLNYVQKFPEFPEGGTSAVNAMQKAFNDLKKSNTSEAKIHLAAGNPSFERFIVFMTDGQMTGSSSSWNASIDSAVRQLCNTAKQDGIVIFTVAFMAPNNGQSLLKACASSTSHYYAPEKMSELVTAFGDIARKASSQLSKLTN